MKNIKLIFFIIFAITLLPQEKSFAIQWNDTSVELNLGYSYDTSIINTDGTTAYYKGYGFLARVDVPLYSASKGLVTSTLTDFSKTFRFGVFLDYKKLYLQNTNSGATSEKAEHTGPSVGAFLRFGGIYLAGSYGKIKGQHEVSGNLHGSTSFEYMPIMYEVGFLYPVADNIEAGLTYSQLTADISKTDTGLAKDSPYNEQMIWLKVNLFFSK